MNKNNNEEIKNISKTKIEIEIIINQHLKKICKEYNVINKQICCICKLCIKNINTKNESKKHYPNSQIR